MHTMLKWIALGALLGVPAYADGLISGSGGGVPSIAGTSNQINESGSPGATTLSLSSTIALPGTLNGITVGSSAGTSLNLVAGSTFATAGAYSTTLTSTNTTNSTLPAGSHSLAPLDSPTFTGPTLGVASGTSLALGGATIGTDALGVTGTTTHNGAVTINGSNLTFSGNISGSGIYGTTGIRTKSVAATFLDTTSSGTVAANYTSVWGGNTLTATTATTLTNQYSAYFSTATCGTNVTCTSNYALGADSAQFNGLVQIKGTIASTPQMAVSGTDTTTSATLGIGVNSTDGGSIGSRLVLIDAGTSGIRWDITNGGQGAGALVFRGGNSINAMTLTTATAAISTGVTLSGLSTGTGSYVCISTGVLSIEATACPASDRAAKNAIGWLGDAFATSKLQSLHSAIFTYKDTKQYGSREHVGLYAQDVEKMDKRCVSYDKRGKIQNYDPNCVIAYLVAANRNITQRLDRLESAKKAKK